MEKEDGKRYRFLTSELEAVYHEAALKFGLSDSAMRILYTICLKGEVCMLSEIIRLSAVSKQTINSSLRKLEREGIIYLETINRKKKKVCLTEEGKMLVQRSVAKIIEIENQILNSWSKEEQQIYIELTEKFLYTFREKIREKSI